MRFRTLATAVLVLGLSAPVVFAQVTDDDKTFLKNASEGSYKEVDFAKLALEKSKNADVRMFATKMIHDHTMLYNSMKPYAAKWNISQPEHQPLTADVKYGELKLLSGDSFDKAYIKNMVEDHHEDLQSFDKEIGSTKVPAFKASVVKGRAVFAAHTKMIEGIAKKYNIS